MRSRGLVATLFVLGAAIVVVVAVLASRFGNDPSLSPSPLIGQPVPDITLDAAEDDTTLALRDLAGDVAVVNFWAPWCVPCRAEHADLTTAAAAYDPFDVTIVGVAYQSDRDDVIGFLDELGRGYPVVMDDRARAAIAFGVRGVPETFFVDRAGTVVAKVNGPVSLDLVTATLDAIILGQTVDESVETGPRQVAP